MADAADQRRWLGSLDTDPAVKSLGAVGEGGDGVQLEFDDLRQVVGRPGDPAGVHIGGYLRTQLVLHRELVIGCLADPSYMIQPVA